MSELKDKICIVTGAGTGIGKGIARRFAKAGATLVLASRKVANLDETAEECRGIGVEVMVHQTDVTSEDSVLALFAATEQAYGRVDILINNSGVFDNGPFHELSLATWQKVVDVNLTGPFLCARSAFRSMLKTGGGRIVNVASISAQMCRPNASPYNSTKHALTGLTKSIALEGRDHDIVCSVLHPGNILTERRATSDTPTDQEPMMTVDELAETALVMVMLPLHVNVLETIVLPTTQAYLGRG
ncbi:MAG: SDR family NAD(P)-dependent oxidoreductase [Caldilineaceae bacterium]|nr:SDR family NAD(P)-dependent oxidoreductase [Caldilineaceae bacterium]